jgi:hypothetical protein
MKLPNPHFDIKITQRSKRQSAVAGAAYQSGETLFSEYDQKRKCYSEKRGIAYTEIMLPSNAPPEYADRGTLWNAVEAIEKQWNAQLARRLVLALPKEVPEELYPQMVREYCAEHFVYKLLYAELNIIAASSANLDKFADFCNFARRPKFRNRLLGSLPKPLKITTLSVVAARSDERFLPYTHVHAVLISHEFRVQSLANPPIEKI